MSNDRELGAESAWLPVFLSFIGNLRIESKEMRGAQVLTPYGAQLRFLAEMCEGLERGVRSFTFLKARQLGISTISLAADIFWLSVHDGIQGALVTDTEGNRDKFRIILARYIESLPRTLRPAIKKHNRNNLVLANGSVLDFLVAGTKRKTDLGKSRALNFVHATECSNWGDPEGIASLQASMAETHPDRLYIFESTANGFNGFWKMWQQAKADVDTQKAIFIGWWAKETYRVSRETELFKRYWDGSRTDEEIGKCDQVLEQYGHKVNAEQVAWYRWKTMTSAAGEPMMAQNFPWTEEEAFVMTGQSFFPTRKMQTLLNDMIEINPPFKAMRYHFSDAFDKTKLEQVAAADEADLQVYEEPAHDGVYAIGCDPAYGRSDYKDRHVIEVWRCYADRLVQVAEFATEVPETYQVSWALAHLAGSYANCIINLEITGPGRAIMDGMRSLRQLFDAGMLPGVRQNSDLSDVFGAVRWYLYHRPDSLSAGYIYNFNTTYDNKHVILNQMRDSFVLNHLEVRSHALADEMRTLVQDGGKIEAAGENKDDRVFATALAHKAWADWLRMPLVEAGDTFDVVRKREEDARNHPEGNAISGIVSEFFKAREVERDAAMSKDWQ